MNQPERDLYSYLCSAEQNCAKTPATRNTQQRKRLLLRV